ncbi:DnaJ like chaperone protein [Tistlia consotensis]|uniref:DnaJ like chaperone protein n=1 Tax=Tistlia consotensis USBA 355 TaxID=560819 RepID=A0A1Y6CL94_9PROT|nr:TerB family tellurite resistance protein [Tistlia consotensis]SMF70986.1 DnaJ like chaperone protein [Tistlia consotensis USBA 355]SNS07201.1 DnaJ like chaperone protein [Tistlia consotensis]
MSIWGKIVGGAAGFMLGGPLGALIGGLAGHAVDAMRDSTRQEMLKDQSGAGQTGWAEHHGHDEASDSARSIAFTIGVIVLGAKMAKADGHVTKDEVSAFKEVFQVPPEEMKNVGRIFNQARRDAHGYEPYARQLGQMFRGRPRVLEELLDGLFHIARADGEVADSELEYLEKVAQAFGFGEADWARIRAANLGPDKRDPYTVLGVPHDASAETIKAAYRKLVRENHPDKLIAQGMPEEFVAVANEKLATINQAYDEVRKRRGFS